MLLLASSPGEKVIGRRRLCRRVGWRRSEMRGPKNEYPRSPRLDPCPEGDGPKTLIFADIFENIRELAYGNSNGEFTDFQLKICEIVWFGRISVNSPSGISRQRSQISSQTLGFSRFSIENLSSHPQEFQGRDHRYLKILPLEGPRAVRDRNPKTSKNTGFRRITIVNLRSARLGPCPEGGDRRRIFDKNLVFSCIL